ncbi:hypothetical protein CIHG_02785 [Coccidioides immitis H538.4]|uniref:Uncharacterized protein n=2 Tax=Coccidioides immitis TaxID=5501 RepID=A0A0J8RJJ0_COCIT|nr:hypothetical protein CIRG_07501 [Coccidioides immitis RMSCC 2394]KMU85002.1 hypothetical protein CIHG_02785 [Coccidioides immitis H538.4]
MAAREDRDAPCYSTFRPADSRTTSHKSVSSCLDDTTASTKSLMQGQATPPKGKPSHRQAAREPTWNHGLCVDGYSSYKVGSKRKFIKGMMAKEGHRISRVASLALAKGKTTGQVARLKG